MRDQDPGSKTPRTERQIEGPAMSAAVRIQSELERKTTASMTFTPAGWAALEDSTADYLSTIGIEAVARARRDALSTVDAVHVDRARAANGSNSTGATLVSIFNSLGGVIAGVGFAMLIALANRPPGPAAITSGEMLWASITSLVGSILLVIAFTVQLNGRKR